MNINGTYIPPRTPQTVLVMDRVPFADSVLKVRKTVIIDIAEVINAPSNKARTNNMKAVKLVGNINLMLGGIKNATIANGTHRISVADNL